MKKSVPALESCSNPRVMTAASLLATASKIFGLYMWVLAALEFRNLIYSIFFGVASPSQRDDAWTPTLFVAFNLIFHIVVGVILIYKAEAISHKLRPANGGDINIPLGKTDITEIVIIAIGCIAILSAVPLMLQKLVSYAYFNDYDPHERKFFWDSNHTAAMIFSVFEFVAGLFLLSNARHFAKRLQRTSEREDARA